MSGNEVGFGLVGFAAGHAIGAFGSSSHVEVAQRGIAEAVNAVEPGEHVLHQQLGLAVGVGGIEARIFLDRNRLRLAIDGGGGGEDEAAGAVGENGLKQAKGGGGVVAKEGFRMDHGLAGLDEGGEVENGRRMAGLVFVASMKSSSIAGRSAKSPIERTRRREGPDRACRGSNYRIQWPCDPGQAKKPATVPPI